MATLIRSCTSTPMLGQNFVWSAGASLEWTEASRGESQPFRRTRNVTTATGIAASASMTG